MKKILITTFAIAMLLATMLSATGATTTITDNTFTIGGDYDIVIGSHIYSINNSMQVNNNITIGEDAVMSDWLLGTTTYNSINDWLDATQSSGKITGGVIEANENGTINVTAGAGFIKTTNSAIGKTQFFDWSALNDITPTENTTTYVYVDYNAGSPTLGTETVKSANGRTKFYLGKVFGHDGGVSILNAGQNVYETQKAVQSRMNAIYGEVVRASGLAITDDGNRNLTITAGVLYAGFTRQTTDAFDSQTGSTFEYYYYDGTNWQYDNGRVINNTNYNDITSGLDTLTANRYGVHWIYMDNSGEPIVVYGQGDYTLTEAEASQPPSSLPTHVSEFSVLIGRILIQEGSETFYGVESAFDTQFTPAGASDHNELTNLQGGTADEYYHFTLAEYTEFQTNYTNWNTAYAWGDWSGEGFLTAVPDGYYSALANFTGTLTDGKICVYDLAGTEIDCNVEPVVDTNTQLTEEEVEDFVGGMLGGTETGISVTYEDGTNDIDFVVTLGTTIDDTEMTAEDFGEFTCTGLEDGCTLNSGAYDDEYIELGDVFGGDVSGTYGAIVVADDSHNHIYSNIDATTSANWANQITDESGTGVFAFTNSPTFVTPTLGVASATTINTGQGDYELYAMNQDVESTDAVTFATVDTGQGANELYDMNQNVLTTSSPTFAGATLTDNVTVSGGIQIGVNSTHFTCYATNGTIFQCVGCGLTCT